MSFSMTFTAQEGGGFEILEPGWYSFAILEVYDSDQEGRELVARSGVKYFKIICEEEGSGSTITHCLFLDEEKPQRVMHFLTATGTSFVHGEPVTFTPGMFAGKRFRGKVTVQDGANRITLTHPIPNDEVREAFTPPEEAPAAEAPAEDPDLNEDVPF